VYLFVMLLMYLAGLYPYLTYRSKVGAAPPNRL
jgi:hypothetical protein